MARNKDFNQEEVIEKAINLFWEKGFNSCSMQDIVDGLGLSRSSIYDTFSDKKNLFILALDAYNKKQTTELISLIENSDNIKKTIESIFQTIIDDLDKSCNQNGCLMINTTIEMAQSDPQIANILLSNKASLENALAKALRKGQEKGIISKDKNPEILSKYLYNNIAGLRVIIKNNPSKEEVKGIIEIILSSI